MVRGGELLESGAGAIGNAKTSVSWITCFLSWTIHPGSSPFNIHVVDRAFGFQSTMVSILVMAPLSISPCVMCLRPTKCLERRNR
jgi:hypothetical protein